jgi:hypothetical protein
MQSQQSQQSLTMLGFEKQKAPWPKPWGEKKPRSMAGLVNKGGA